MAGACSECDLPAHCRGLCRSHYNKAYYAANADRMRARARAWHAENPEKAAQIRARRDPEKLRRAAREFYWRDRLGGVARAANAKAKRLGIAGVLTSAGLAARIAYYGGLCWVCRCAADSIDHVIPLAEGGPNIHANIRPACLSCNTTRGANLRWSAA